MFMAAKAQYHKACVSKKKCNLRSTPSGDGLFHASRQSDLNVSFNRCDHLDLILDVRNG